MSLPFIKMNGLGNDFVIVGGDVAPSPFVVRRLGARSGGGVGFDQLVAVVHDPEADVRLRLWNSDGGEVEACGNATRCVAWLLAKAGDRPTWRIRAGDRILEAAVSESGEVTVDMGAPGLGWRDIPLAWEMDTREIQLRVGSELSGPGCVSMGNPHAVFFVPNADEAPVERVGPIVENHWLFPNRSNVGFASVIAPDRLRLRVWERGAGLTKACGTGACAAVVAAHRRGLLGRKATVVLDGGELLVDWRESDGHVLMTGPVAVEFTGRVAELEPLP